MKQPSRGIQKLEILRDAGIALWREDRRALDTRVAPRGHISYYRLRLAGIRVAVGLVLLRMIVIIVLVVVLLRIAHRDGVVAGCV